MTVADQHTEFVAHPDAANPVPGVPATPVRSSTASRMTSRQVLTTRVLLGVLLAATAALYLIGLSKSGWANSFYSAAAQAGSKSWEAWFYGSLDAGNSITVDKPPASLWVMGLSVRLFGLSSWSILVPQALMGVGAVWVLYLAVVRALGFDTSTRRFRPTPLAHAAGLLAGLTLAVTPAAALMFRFNNPDALLVLLEVVAAYCVIRATHDGSRKWLVLAGVAIGFGFLTKMLQAFIVLPGFVIAYAVAAPRAWKRKIVDLVLAFAAMVVSAGWYVAIVELVPASSRPYIGGSQTNSFLELVFGYNGFGRITGNESGSVGGGGGGAGGGWGATGITRMFDSTSGGMISWLIPAALILFGFAVALLGRRAWRNLRGSGTTSSTQALSGLIVFVGWLVVTDLVFSYMAGIYHDYYTVALAPGIAGAFAIGAVLLWQRRAALVARIGLSVTTGFSAVWAKILLDRAGGSWATLGTVVLVVGLLAAVGLILVNRLTGWLPALVAIVALLAVQAGPVAYSLETASTAHTGSIVTAGPAVQGGSGGPGGAPGGGRGQFGGQGRTGGFGGTGGQRFGGPGTGTGTMPQGGTQGTGTTGTGSQGTGTPGTQSQGTQSQGTGTTGTGGMTRGGAGMGGLLNGAEVSSAISTLLTTDASKYTWVAATVGSQNAASYQLATDEPVMAIGGFNGSDPSPTLAQFKQYVAEGKIHYFIGGGSFGGQNGGSNDASEIATWVSQNFTAKTVDGVTVYDLSSGS